MLFQPMFRGDDDAATIREQHDVRHKAIAKLPFYCRRHFRAAAAMLGQPVPDRWCELDEVVPHGLQRPHDILAAAWRFRTQPRQLRLPLEGHSETTFARLNRWFIWLHNELESWREEPHLVQPVMTILVQQNTEAGQFAERLLTERLLWRFADVPWRRDLARLADLPPQPLPAPEA